MPPSGGYDGTGQVGDGIDPIPRGVGDKMRPRDLTKQRPHDEVEGDLAKGGRVIVMAPAEATLYPKHERQRGGDE